MINNISKIQIKLVVDKASNLISANKHREVVRGLKIVLDTKCPFTMLDLLGKEIGQRGSNQPQRFFRATVAKI